jgi:hypothetical protein
MKNIIIATALAFAAAVVQAQTPAPQVTAPTPQPAKWYTLYLTSEVIAKPAYLVWDKIGGTNWCAIEKYLDIQSCRIDSGRGELGSVRTINGSIVEIVVARTPYSYTYAQPFTPIFYHGTLGVEAIDATHSKITYNLLWNESGVGDAAAQAAARDSRQKRFQAAVDKMQAAAKAD